MSRRVCIETWTGKHFAPLAPVVADICIEDIAHALSNQCRFSGHTRVHYSVAEHSVRVSEFLERFGGSRQVQLWGLLHDASEAYLVDLPTPLKDDPSIGEPYKAAEHRLMLAVCERFGLPADEPPSVTYADRTMLATEARDLLPFTPSYWAKLTHKPLAEVVVPWEPGVARIRFLDRFKELTR